MTNREQLSFTVVGQGPPLLLIHGFGANVYTWHRLVEYFASQYTVISLDLKGHGRSPKPLDERYSLRDHASVITEFILAKGLHNLTIVGHSFGGAIALLSVLKLETRGRDAIRALVLIDTIAYRQHVPGLIQALCVPLLGSFLVHILPERIQVQLILRLVYHNSERITEETIQAYAAPLRSNEAKEALLCTARSIVPADIDEITSQYAMIDAPTLLLWGEHDRIVPYTVQDQLVRALPRAKLVTLLNTGHAPQEETPLAVFVEMFPFLRAVYSDAGLSEGMTL